MTKYVVPIDMPAAGADWSAVVPGIYEYDVVGITATLATGATLGPMFAVVYDAGTGTVTFYVNDRAWGTDTQAAAPVFIDPAQVTIGTSLGAGSTYDEMVIFPAALGPTDIAGLYAASNVSYALWAATVLGLSPAAYYQLDPFPAPGGICADVSGNGNDLTYSSNTGTFPLVAAPGLVAGNGAVNANGVQVASGPVAGIGTGSFTVLGWVQEDTPGTAGLIPFNLADGVGNTVILLESAGTPTTPLMRLFRVTSNAPPIFNTYISDDGQFGTSSGTGRQPSLLVTDGTNDVLLIPTGFAAVGTSGPYSYAWQPGLNADTQSTDGTLTTVAIPRLIMPPGYTVGTQTLDLQPFDQWSNVSLWWDDTYQKLNGDTYDYGFPPGRFYVYQRTGSQP